MIEFYENQLRLQYRLLRHEGQFTQAHCQNVNDGRLISRELLNGEEEIIAWAKENNGKGNVFIGRAPRDSSGAVQAAHCLSLDIDPIRPKGSAATTEQHDSAIIGARAVTNFFHYGIVASSGNGAFVIFPLKEAAGKEQSESWGKALEQKAREILSGRPLNVDHTWDFARICKAMGTVSTKGDQSLWRTARFIDSPHRPGSSDIFYRWLESLHVGGVRAAFPHPVQPGELDRSKADYAYVSRLKLQGFSKEDAYRSLVAFSFRPGREDDHARIVSKIYDSPPVVSGGSSREITLVTPQSGIAGYKQRDTGGLIELPTGFDAIDRATFGLVRGSIFCVGARTNTGKTTFAISTALQLCRTGKRVLFLSTETTYHEIWDRYIGAATGTSAFALQHGIHLNGHQRLVDEFMHEFQSKHQLTIYDGSRPNIEIVRAAVEKAAPDALIFDYFQHVEGRDTKALEEFVMGLKDLAKEKNIAVLMCAQLHDRYNPVTRKQFPPTLGDLKNCKMLADESRVVLLLDWDRDEAEGDGPAAVKAILAKNKGSKLDSVLRLNRSIPRFENA